MALEFKDGIASLVGRENDVCFDSGAPVNSEGWDQIKRLPDVCRGGKEVQVSCRLVSETFNSVRDVFTRTIIQTETDRFALFCRQNGLTLKEVREKAVFLVWRVR